MMPPFDRSNPFRFLDSALVAVDVVILVSTMILTGSGDGSAQSAKATVKLARVVRLARSARWLRGIKVLRSCRFVTKLANAWRRSALPTRKVGVAEKGDFARLMQADI